MKLVKKGLSCVLMYSVMLFVIIISLFPILWVILSSFKTNAEILGNPLSLPASFSFDAFIHLFENYNFPVYFANSLLSSVVATAVSLLIYSMGAYVIAKYRFPGRMLLYLLFTITLLVPGHSRTQPIFSLIMKLGLYDNIWGVTAVYL